jgi:peroxiredoxin
MRCRLIVLALFFAAIAATAWLARPSHADKPSTAQVGKKIANISFTDEKGGTFMLHDLKDKKAIVLVFVSFDCPVSTGYSQVLAEMATEFGKQGVTFVGLTVNQDESRAEVAKQAKAWKLPFQIVLDKDYAAVDAVKAEFTPEVFVLDGNHVLRYRGRIDNTYYARLKKNPQVTQHDLRQVLSEIISGRPVSTKATLAIGCPIVREVPAAPKVGNVTYYKDVLPILQNHCQECHRPGEVGPFSLMTYRQAVNWASDIKDFTQSKRMPPWKISAGMEFHNQRKLTAQEIAVLAAWVDNATLEGNPKDAPPAKKFTQGWQLGTPDLVLTVGEEFQVGPTGNDVFRCFVLPTNLTEDKYVAAVEVRPGNPRVVHHALLAIDNNGQGRKLEKDQKDNPKKDPHGGNELDKGPGYYGGMGFGFLPTSSLGGWAPGQLARQLPDGTGIKLPKNSDVVMQMHYHRNGRTEKDKTQIGIYFSKKAVDKPFQGGVMMGLFVAIPAGNAKFVVKGTSHVSEDLKLHSIMPHMHMLGKEIKVTMTPPDGKAALLFHIKEWDYNWQETYYFKEPLKLAAGTKLELEAVYDNTADNPHNPFKPPQTVTFGEQTTNEMCFVFLGGTSSRAGVRLPVSRLAPGKKGEAKK